jgi:hypothetical protein
MSAKTKFIATEAGRRRGEEKTNINICAHG